MFFDAGESRVELLSALHDESPISRFVDRRGPGLHHLCFEVMNLEESLDRALAVGAEVIEPRIREGAGGSRVSFLHPRKLGGVLLELREHPAEGEQTDGEKRG